MDNEIELYYCGAGGKSRYDSIALSEGWKLGVRSDGKVIPDFNYPIDFVDNHWKKYDHARHIKMVKKCRPHLATARDIERIEDLPAILREAEEIAQFSDFIILIPKIAITLPYLSFNWRWGFSVPTKYGQCDLPLSFFGDRPIHLLGGSPRKQASYRHQLNIVSLDCNSIMLSAKFGKIARPDLPEIKTNGGCYEAFKKSCRATKQYWHAKCNIKPDGCIFDTTTFSVMGD